MGGAVELGLVEVDLGGDDLGQDQVEGRHQDDHDLALGDLDEPDVMEVDPGDPRRQDEPEAVGLVGQEPGGLVQDRVEIAFLDRQIAR